MILGLFAAAGAALAAFVLYEPRRQDALVDLRFFRSVPFTSATLLAMCAFASFAGFLFLNVLYLQQARGFSALHTGLCTLPLAVMMTVCAPLSGRMVGSYGTRPSLLLAGMGFLVSTLLLTRLSVDTPLAVLLVAYALFGVGLGMVNPAITNSCGGGDADVAGGRGGGDRVDGAAGGRGAGGWRWRERWSIRAGRRARTLRWRRNRSGGG